MTSVTTAMPILAAVHLATAEQRCSRCCCFILLFICIAAAYDLLTKKSRLFSFGSNNAFLEFFLQVRARECHESCKNSWMPRLHTLPLPLHTFLNPHLSFSSHSLHLSPPLPSLSSLPPTHAGSSRAD